jgi:rhomboid protease GluP
VDANPPPRDRVSPEVVDAVRWIEALDRHVRRPVLGIVFAAVNAAIFVWMVAQGVDARDPSPEDLARFGANSWDLSLGREPWRLLTAGFLHVGLIHLAVNSWSLTQLGLVERLLGRSGWLAVFFVSILAGSLVSAARHGPVGAGASGGLFGLLGAITAFGVASGRSGIPGPIRSRLLTAGLQNVGLNVMIAFFVPRLDHWAHGGGFVAGAVMGLVLLRAPSDEQASRRGRRAAVVSVAAAALLGAAWLALRSPAAAAPVVRDSSSARDDDRLRAANDEVDRVLEGAKALQKQMTQDAVDVGALRSGLGALRTRLRDTMTRIAVPPSSPIELLAVSDATRRAAEDTSRYLDRLSAALDAREAIDRARERGGR